MYIIGIDGGGTKTSFVSFDGQGNTIKQCVLPSCHVLQKTEAEMIHILQEGVQAVLSELDSKEDVIISAGLAGYGQDLALRQKIEKVCEQAFYPYRWTLTNDAETALYAALEERDGVLVIAGTGSIALAKRHSQLHRCGGWGYQLGDEGSAYWLVKQLFQLFTKQSDGRVKKTALYEELIAHFQLSTPFELIQVVSHTLQNDRTKIASIAPIIETLLQKGDEQVYELVEKAGEELAELVNATACYYIGEKAVPVGLQGSVWRLEALKQSFERHLIPPFYVLSSQHTAEYGAFRRAKELFHL